MTKAPRAMKPLPETPEERAQRETASRLAREATELLRAAGFRRPLAIASQQGPDGPQRRRYSCSLGRRGIRRGGLSVAEQADEKRIHHFCARSLGRVLQNAVNRAVASTAQQETER